MRFNKKHLYGFLIVVCLLWSAIFIISIDSIGVDLATERASSILKVIVKVLTVITLLFAIFLTPPFFKNLIVKEYLKDAVKAMQLADMAVYKEAVILLEKLNMVSLTNRIVSKEDLVFLEKDFSALRLLALEGKRETLTLLTLTHRLLKFLIEEFDEQSKTRKLTKNTLNIFLEDILVEVIGFSSSIVQLPKTSELEKSKVINEKIKFVKAPPFENFKHLPRGLDFKADSPIPLIFFDFVKSTGDILLFRAAALALAPKPFLARLLNHLKIYIPPEIKSQEIKQITGENLELSLIGFVSVNNLSTGGQTVKAYYSNLDRFFVVLGSPEPDSLKQSFWDSYLDGGFFKEVEIKKIRRGGKEIIEMTFEASDVQRYYSQNRRKFHTAIKTDK
ncbi:MAG: hypothetical protein H6557_17750 [Lewinellaceae bacterium]|nr:hypothetical protein [Phaeodactylibacter sp.]MCB9038458.1 hypothetical protein [Lewinellaceae bacterium]